MRIVLRCGLSIGAAESERLACPMMRGSMISAVGKPDAARGHLRNVASRRTRGRPLNGSSEKRACLSLVLCRMGAVVSDLVMSTVISSEIMRMSHLRGLCPTQYNEVDFRNVAGEGGSWCGAGAGSRDPPGGEPVSESCRVSVVFAVSQVPQQSLPPSFLKEILTVDSSR